MKLRIRRVGNSLGALLPKPLLDRWGVGEGDFLELAPDDASLRPSRQHRQVVLDDLKLLLSMEVASRFSEGEIRRKSLENLRRWKKRGAWVRDYDEWAKILSAADPGILIRTMIGRDERSNRLRQSMPYVGMLPKDAVERLREKVAG